MDKVEEKRTPAGADDAGRQTGEETERKVLRGPFGGRAFYIGRIFGIEIGLDKTWIIIFLLVTVTLASQFRMQYENWSGTLYWTTALATSLLFFASLLLHELGHSVTSNKLGLPIHSITLFIFGGVARLTREPDRPRDEFLIAVAGPIVSVILGFGFLALARVIPDERVGQQALGATFAWLGRINLILVVFNCVPGFPLDGGRILRSALWAATKDHYKATRIAGGFGAAFAYFLILMGILIGFAAGNFISGLWMAFIGWFLLQAANSSVTQVFVRDRLSTIHVGDVFNEHYIRIPAAMSVAELVEGLVLRQGHRTFFVEDNGAIVGLVTLHEARKVPREEWSTTPVRQVALPIDRVHSLRRDNTLWEALMMMDEEEVNQLPVLENSTLLGVLSRDRVIRLIRTHAEIDR